MAVTSSLGPEPTGKTTPQHGLTETGQLLRNRNDVANKTTPPSGLHKYSAFEMIQIINSWDNELLWQLHAVEPKQIKNPTWK